jgi:hypothetical protein
MFNQGGRRKHFSFPLDDTNCFKQFFGGPPGRQEIYPIPPGSLNLYGNAPSLSYTVNWRVHGAGMADSEERKTIDRQA